jgi:hypothetical protein
MARRKKNQTPASRPLRLLPRADVTKRFASALTRGDGVEAAHCVHEFWMRGDMSASIEPLLHKVWTHCQDSVPDWLPMRHVEWLSIAYDVAAGFKSTRKGRSNIYMVLLDYSDRNEPFGVYVGMTAYSPQERFDQHKAGLRAAGSVLKRGLEVLVGPTLHLQKISRVDAARIEEELANALSAAGLLVKGGH